MADSIQLKDISFRYSEKEKHSIKHITLDAEEGECIVIAGGSGCGKTTLTRCINGLIPHFYEGELAGSGVLLGRDMTNMRISDISKCVASVFQDPKSQFFTLDVMSELIFACENYGYNKVDIDRKLSYVIELLNLNPLLDKKLNKMSNGEKQRIAIASALMLNGKVLLLDEPSSNLDYRSIENLKRVLQILKADGFTIIISEHRLYYLKELCDRLVLIKDGGIEKTYTIEELDVLGNSEIHKGALEV